MAFDITALNAALGAYLRKHGEEVWMDAIYNPADSDEAVTAWDLMRRVIIKDEKTFGLADFQIEVMEASDDFTDQGDVVVIDGVTAKLRRMDSSFTIPVYSLYGSWMHHLYEEAYKNNINTGDITAGMLSFAEWLFTGIIQKFMENFMLRTSFLGTYTADYGYTGGATNSFDAAADGLLTLAKAARTAGDIPAGQIIATGALTNANAYEQFEAMGRAIPTKLHYKDMFLMTSIGNSDNYNQDYRTTWGNNNVNIYDKYKRRRLDDREKCIIVPTPEMGSDGGVFITPPDNMIWFSDFDRRPPQILTAVADPKKIKVTLMYSAAYMFRRKDHLIINDQ